MIPIVKHGLLAVALYTAFLTPRPEGAPPVTYTVTGVTYVTLATGSGTSTFASYAVSVNGGQGGGAVKSADACGKDVSDCVTGTVSGTSGAVLVNVSSPQCAKAMRNCATITVTLRNGATFSIDVPGFLCVATPIVPEEVAAGVHTFPVLVNAAPGSPVALATYGPGAGGGTHGSLPPQVLTTPGDGVPVEYEGWIGVAVDVAGKGTAKIGLGATTFLEVHEGVGFVTVDTTLVEPGSRVIVTTWGDGLDKGRASFLVK